MPEPLSTECLITSWTLLEPDWALVGNKTGVTRVGFAVLLKFFENEARFPRSPEEVPTEAVSFVARQVGVAAELFDRYSWSGRIVERHRAQIRAAYGFREPTEADEALLAAWLAADVCPLEMRDAPLCEALLARCRANRVEPPGRLERIIGSARARFEQRFCDATLARLGVDGVARLEALVADDDGRRVLAELKADPGQAGLETLLREVDKLTAARAVGLPVGLFDGVSDRLVEAWRARATRSYPSDLAAAAQPVRVTLLASLVWLRTSEVTDALVDLLIAVVAKLNTRADRRVERELTADLRRVRGKEGLLFRLAEAAVEHPDDTVREALFPVVTEATLRDLVREAKANDAAFKARVRTVLRSSYSSHYRRMLAPLLGALGFRCNNIAYRPVMQAVELLVRYASVPGTVRFYDRGDVVPIEGVVPKGWRDAVITDDGRVERVPFELCTLIAVRDALRRREIWVEGASRWRNPDLDLPADFDTTRSVHYAALRQPTDPTEFIAGLRARLSSALGRLDTALAGGTTGGVRIVTRNGQPWITIAKPDPLPEPVGLDAVKDEVLARWGTIDLLDVLKEADFLSGFTSEFVSVASREVIDRNLLRRRLLLCLFALGTNMGIKAIVNTGEHAETETVLRHVRRHYITRDNLRRAIVKLVNATMAARDPFWWGDGTACASDSKKFGSWDST